MGNGMTLAVLAKRLGVSRATVAAAISGTGGNTRVNPLKAAVIRQAAFDMGYIPNAAARATVTGRFNSVTLIQSTVRFRSLMPEAVLDGVHDGLARRGIHLMISKLPDEKLSDPASAPYLLRELVCDGFIINYQAEIPERFEELIRQHKIPAYWINSKHGNNCVYPNEHDSAVWITRRLISLGHRRIVFSMFHDFLHFSTYDRFGGYSDAMKEAGLEPRLARYEDMPHREICAVLSKELRRADAPTAVLGYTGDVGRVYLRAAESAGLNVPGDFSIAVFSDVTADDITHTVATMLLPEYEMGTAAAEGITALVEDPSRELPSRVLPCDFIEGDTLGPAHEKKKAAAKPNAGKAR